MTVEVADARLGHAQVVVRFASVKLGAALATVLIPYVGQLAAGSGATLRYLDRRFAVGFLDNVQRVLEGRGIGSDSAVPPGLEKWQKRSREV